MSEIAGRIAAQIGACLLHQPQGGKGLLLGGIHSTEAGRVVILGAGSAGRNAAEVVAALGAEVRVFDLREDRLAVINRLSPNITASLAEPSQIDAAVTQADLVIGAALRTGAEAPHIVSRKTVAAMRPGSVVVDISVDQGGCIETTRPTSYDNPTYIEEGVVHFAVTNMPGAVPRSATQALSITLLDYVLKLAGPDWQTASPALSRGINIAAGKYIHAALIEAFAK
jgi:alanine dehydrogenase